MPTEPVILIKMLICLVFLAVINITDIKGYKIKNRDIVIMIAAGLVLNLFSNSIRGSLLGMLLPLVLFPLFALKMLGAGDIKALCAIGSVVGIELSVMTVLLSFVSGGIMAIGFMAFNKNFIERIKYLYIYIKTCFVMRRVCKYEYGGGEKSYFRFSYAITAGTVLTFVNYYLNIL